MSGAGLSLKARITNALAEAGWPDAKVREEKNDVSVVLLPTPGGVPERALWQAFRIAGDGTTPCFECWGLGEALEGHDECEERLIRWDQKTAAGASGSVVSDVAVKGEK